MTTEAPDLTAQLSESLMGQLEEIRKSSEAGARAAIIATLGQLGTDEQRAEFFMKSVMAAANAAALAYDDGIESKSMMRAVLAYDIVNNHGGTLEIMREDYAAWRAEHEAGHIVDDAAGDMSRVRLIVKYGSDD